MSSNLVPGLVSVRKSLISGAKLSGRVNSENLQRLHDAVISAGESFDVDLAFVESSHGKGGIDIRVTGDVHLECQRCLGEVRTPIESVSTLVLVLSDEQAQSLPKDCDPWVVADDELDVYSLVEEEILLALPIIAMHSNTGLEVDNIAQQCVENALAGLQASSEFQSIGEEVQVEEASQEAQSTNPFLVLKNLNL